MQKSITILAAVFLAELLAFVPPSFAWESSAGAGPTSIANEPISGFVVDRQNRADVLSFYHHIYRASENSAAVMGWTGNYASCVEGTTTQAYKDMVRRRVNYFRAMAGLPANITFDAFQATGIAAPKWRCAQKAALMQTAHNRADLYSDIELSHNPPSTWECYSAEGYNGSSKGNLAVGLWGPEAITAYMNELDDVSVIVGHRRWLLYSRAQDMSSGDVPSQNLTGSGAAYRGGNCLYILGNEAPLPAPRFTPWPSAGYFPAQLSSDRWSLSYPGANFTNATVTMTGPGVTSVSVLSKTVTNTGDNTIVWKPLNGSVATFPRTVTADTAYNVTISGIAGTGIPASYNYTVTMINTEDPAATCTLTGPSAPPAVGARYSINQVPGADGYAVRIGPINAAAFKEGGETTTASLVLDQTTSRNASNQSVLFQSAVTTTVAFTPKAGSRALHLCYQDGVVSDQIVELDRDILPTSTSNLVFWKMFRFVTSATTCVVETSIDGGNTWDNLSSFAPAATISSSASFEAWSQRTVSLASRAGKLMRLRFRLTVNAAVGYTPGTTHNHGLFLDEIEVTSCSRMDSPKVTIVPAGSSFVLDSTFANGGLVAGTQYCLTYQPVMGFTEFDYSNVMNVTPTSQTGYSAWTAGFYPALNGLSPDSDYDKDGQTNVLEYAFGSDPTNNQSQQTPTVTKTSTNLTLSFTKPSNVTGLTYTGQFSTNLQSWTTLTNQGSGNNMLFVKPTSGTPCGYIRVKVTTP